MWHLLDSLIIILYPCESCANYYYTGSEKIKSFRTNVPIELNLKEAYVSDVVVTKVDGSIFVRECVQREHLCRTSMGELLDKSRTYWHSKGIDDWGIIIESEDG